MNPSEIDAIKKPFRDRSNNLESFIVFFQTISSYNIAKLKYKPGNLKMLLKFLPVFEKKYFINPPTHMALGAKNKTQSIEQVVLHLFKQSFPNNVITEITFII